MGKFALETAERRSTVSDSRNSKMTGRAARREARSSGLVFPV